MKVVTSEKFTTFPPHPSGLKPVKGWQSDSTDLTHILVLFENEEYDVLSEKLSPLNWNNTFTLPEHLFAGLGWAEYLKRPPDYDWTEKAKKEYDRFSRFRGLI